MSKCVFEIGILLFVLMLFAALALLRYHSVLVIEFNLGRNMEDKKSFFDRTEFGKCTERASDWSLEY